MKVQACSEPPAETAEANADHVVNAELRGHAIKTDWHHAELVATLYSWQDRFNERFFSSSLPPAAVSVSPDRKSVLGTYQMRRDGLALRYRINMNSLYVQRGTPELLRTLLHEVIHLWEEVVHGRNKGGRYHSATFRDMAGSLGIPCDAQGRSLPVPLDGRFARLLAEFGLAYHDSPLRRPASRSTLRRWSCACTKVWAAKGVELALRCERCAELLR